jgi:phosphatidylinositol kinase/protein kinase (PI-3  family)
VFLKIDQGVKASLKTITISKNMKDDAPKQPAHEENFPSVGRKEKELKQKLAEDENKGKKIVNKNTEKAIARIRSKLNGRDFKDEIPLNEENQVGKLIRQATSPENICQSFLGWNPFV